MASRHRYGVLKTGRTFWGFPFTATCGPDSFRPARDRLDDLRHHAGIEQGRLQNAAVHALYFGGALVGDEFVGSAAQHPRCHTGADQPQNQGGQCHVLLHARVWSATPPQVDAIAQVGSGQARYRMFQCVDPAAHFGRGGSGQRGRRRPPLLARQVDKICAMATQTSRRGVGLPGRT